MSSPATGRSTADRAAGHEPAGEPGQQPAGAADEQAAGAAGDPAAGAAGDLPAGDADKRPAPAASRSLADRIARKVLLIGDADPQALMSLKGSLVLSAIRCVITYAILPALSPLIGWSGAVARPVSIALSLAAVALAVFSLRRVWLADWTYRWSYTAFIAVVLGFLGWFIVLDTRALLAG